LLKLWLQLWWSHLHFMCISAVHIIPFYVSFLSWVIKYELNKLACSKCMGLHSSVGRALQRECRAHSVNPLEALKIFSIL